MAAQPISVAERWTIPADLCRVAPLVLAAASFLEQSGVGPKALFKAQLLLEETVTNVVRHALHGDAARAIDIEVGLDGADIRLVIEDDAIPFDPFQNASMPDTAAPLEARTEGGMGVHLIRQIADDVVYERRESGNRVSLRLAVA